MYVGFMNAPEDAQWLRETHLKGVPLPSAYAGFQSFTLQGNEDSPHAVNLYVTASPTISDNFYRVRFDNESGVYAVACEYSGESGKPLGGLSPIE